MNLFDLNKKVFNPIGWDEVSNADKRKNFFMLNRFFSIGHPLQAHALQHIKINQAAVIDFWQFFLSKKYGKVPFWIFTKGKKKSEQQKEKKTNINKDVLNEYIKINKIDRKIAEDAILHFPEQFSKELKAFEKTIKK
jgi:hypothetical protein